jgi:hypothetical protein
MPNILTQEEADNLLAIEKIAVANEAVDFPDFGGKLEFDFWSIDKREEFVLNFNRSRINLAKRNHQIRVQKVTIIARLDLDGPPHRNPDGEEISSRHLHLYKEGYGDKWAYTIPDNHFSNLDDPYQTLHDFMKYCNIIQPPEIIRGLFT